jgi:hypothetical protein
MGGTGGPGGGGVWWCDAEGGWGWVGLVALVALVVACAWCCVMCARPGPFAPRPHGVPCLPVMSTAALPLMHLLPAARCLQAHSEGRLIEAFGCGTACIVQPVGSLVRWVNGWAVHGVGWPVREATPTPSCGGFKPCLPARSLSLPPTHPPPNLPCSPPLLPVLPACLPAHAACLPAHAACLPSLPACLSACRSSGEVFTTTQSAVEDPAGSLSARLQRSLMDIQYGQVEHPWSVPLE